jgi:NADP-dependent 3-hydroxy acid dehydrogenase YdfG
MLDRGPGDVVFVSSLAGRRVPRADGTVYAATKHAMSAIAEALRMELHAKGVRAISVEPGLVRTEFPSSSFPRPKNTTCRESTHRLKHKTSQAPCSTPSSSPLT